MPELRKDPVVGRWVIISTERAKRPSDFVMEEQKAVEKPCPFCEGNEQQTPPEILAIREPNTKPNGPGWHVRVVPSIAPVLRIEGNLDRRGHGMYDIMNGIGAHEIVIETPGHISNLCDLTQEQIARMITAYCERIIDLQKDKRFKYVLLFKNYGVIAGAGIVRHSRSQLIATPVTPQRVKEELTVAKTYYDYKERCLFCDIIKQEIDTGKRVVADMGGFLVYAPFASRFPFELAILPREHSCDFFTLKKAQIESLAGVMKIVFCKLRKALNDPPFNFILHTAPFRTPRAGYWRSIEFDYHWHLEVMPRLTKVAGFEWGSGFYINPTPPEEAANYLRNTEA
jgi:UDPglucose--hexose-1-phosphate uridylyltransferase